MKKLAFAALALAALLAGGAVRIVQDQCGPFTDVTPGFCPFILELYYLGVTVGTSATTFSPDDPLTRGQGAVFVAKGLNQALARSSRRAALGQWWTTSAAESIGLTGVGASPLAVRSDGVDLWVAALDGTVTRVRGSDGRALETWTGATGAVRVLVAMGRVFVVGGTDPGKLFMIDPTQPSGPVTPVADLGSFSSSIAFDGNRIWVGNSDSISIVEPATWTVTRVSGFNTIHGLLWDGSSMWVTQLLALLRLDGQGNVTQSIPLGKQGGQPAYDGQNIWVPTTMALFGEVVVVRATTGDIVKVLPLPDTQDAIPYEAAFDGIRILVTDANAYRVMLWNAADLSSLGQFPLTSPSFGTCSDGLNFWFAMRDANKLARF